MIQNSSKVGSDNYPETFGRAYFVNAPGFFNFLYAIVKGWLDEKTRNKIQVLGADYKEELLKHIDADQLPKFLGGTCECEGGCMHSDKGPWNDYEPVQPFGFREKAKPSKGGEFESPS